MNKIIIKVCFRHSIVNLGKSISSYAELLQEVKKRFLTQFNSNTEENTRVGVALYYEGQQVKNLESLVSRAEQQKKTTVKIQAFNCIQQIQNTEKADSSYLDLSEIHKNIHINLNEQSQQINFNQKKQNNMSFCSQNNQEISAIKQKNTGIYRYMNEEKSESDQEICDSLTEKISLGSKYCFKESNQDLRLLQCQDQEVQRYECFHCSQDKDYFQQENNCKICNGTGYLDQNHKIVKFVGKLVQKKFQALMKKMNLQNFKQISEDKKGSTKIQVEEEPDKKSQKVQKAIIKKQLSPDDIKIKVKYGDQKMVKKSDEIITWQFQVTNIGQLDIPDDVYIRDMKTYKIIGIQGLKVNQSKKIKVGPFENFEAGITNVQMFQIFYKVSSQVRYPIGQKFGFVCELQKSMDRKVINSSLFNKVNQLKEFSECQKSTQNILMRFKELGIDQKNIQNYNDQDIINLIEACQ